MDFSTALEELKGHKKVARAGWHGQGLGVQYPDARSKNTLPYIYMISMGDRVPWLPSQVDIMANDWSVIT